MERGNQVTALLHKHRTSMITGEHMNTRAGAANDGGADEDGFDVAFAGALLKFGIGLNPRHPAVELAAIAIALDGHIDNAETFLRRVLHLRREEDGSGAGTEHRLALREFQQRLPEVHVIQELEHGGALAARNNQAVNRVQFPGRADLHGVGAGALKGLFMRFKIALQRQYADPLLHYQPRLAISSLSGSFEISRPGMAMPRSSLASRSFSGSL